MDESPGAPAWAPHEWLHSAGVPDEVQVLGARPQYRNIYQVSASIICIDVPLA